MLLGNTDYNVLFNIGAMPNYFADSLGNVGPVSLEETKPQPKNNTLKVLFFGVGAFLVYKMVR